MKLSFTGASDPGLIRSNNQDFYYIDPKGRFFIVADGMGGHAGGEEASRIAAEEIKSFLLANWDSEKSSQYLLEEALGKANQAILQDQEKNPERADMGTTIVVVTFRNGETPWRAHVGDSRLYRFREQILEQMTQDHTWVARAIQFGDITPDEARMHPFRHVLSQCLGREDLQEFDVKPLEVQSGDRLLLCSDGLTEELMDEKIASFLTETPTLDKAAVNLIQAAKDQGGHDNITVILVSLEDKSVVQAQTIESH
ncbi:Stp1/IreP family PP2C-type Ser/Thr phosphatase [Mastigocoleus testarum]|uniref:Serine/threonine protein phosphatase n=1 Tax=Mastigocoleus testarum BC008 TaxID=371196 RepID=A0A0V7ZJK7_9CYAN|nr:Stp1/IreP family PP2C-type Ser/Thr phosphatase [Mastigocoleus testarum]KST64007.1 serine/threonine protein phosphatase [Mastigocoleus testarum BC008]KST64717.1 serine/threonine protein phosphatase [Mastigocoleus testarum BC008]